MNITDSERLIILMLCDISKRLKGAPEMDPEFIESALIGGHLWAFKWKYSSIFHGEETDRETVREVCDILDMWENIEISYSRLTPAERQAVQGQAGVFGQDVKFRGFDGNRETDHLSTARFLIEKLDRYEHFSGRDLNSHMPIIDANRRMLKAYKALNTTESLSAAHLSSILAEQIHPENR